MNVKLKIISIKEITKLKRMMQLYLHDISYYFALEIDNESLLYKYDNLEKYCKNIDSKAFFIIVDDIISGFILLDKDIDLLIIQELFILNNYKNKNIGTLAVLNLLDKYTGNWLVKVLPCSSKAKNFWENVIKKYTSDNYEKTLEGKYNRAIFKFSN